MAEPIQDAVRKDKVDKHRAICSSLNRIYEKKNHDYGDSFGTSIKTLGVIAAVTRIYDKMQRVISLTKANVKPQVNDESLLDTLMDMANYSIMTIIELGGTYDVCEPEPDREPTRISSALPDLPGEYTERSSVKS